jgi:hypothetical protein
MRHMMRVWDQEEGYIGEAGCQDWWGGELEGVHLYIVG